VNLLIWIEQTPVGVWVRESPTLWAFPFSLFLHTLGLAVLAGISVALNLWILTFAGRYPLAPMRTLFPIMWMGFTVNLASGLLLLAAYPAKALTTPIFYIKMGMVFLAMLQIEWVRKLVFVDADPRLTFQPSRKLNALAIVSLLLWAGTVVTGRLLAYTHHILLVSDGF
jgi:energy-converting hydrogenase Eha subunit H